MFYKSRDWTKLFPQTNKAIKDMDQTFIRISGRETEGEL